MPWWAATGTKTQEQEQKNGISGSGQDVLTTGTRILESKQGIKQGAGTNRG